MTTILTLKYKDSWWLACDTQITQGNLKIPAQFYKVLPVSKNILLGSSGSVGNAQHLLKAAIKNLKIRQVLLEEEQSGSLSPHELAGEIGELCFNMPLEYEHYRGSDFLLAGIDLENFTSVCYSVGSDGSVINIPEYFAIGSGSEFALPLLSSILKKKKMSDKVVCSALKAIIEEAAAKDIYTSKESYVWQINAKRGIVKWE